MRMRLKFGPRVVGPVIRPVVVGEKIDPEVSVSIDHFEAGDPEKVHVHLSVSVAPFEPATSSKLLAVHAIAFGPTDGLPTEERKALQSTNPQGSVVATAEPGGYTLALTVNNVPAGPATILTVLVFDDDAPAPSVPATSPAGDAPTTS